jgi:hypothetical protein
VQRLARAEPFARAVAGGEQYRGGGGSGPVGGQQPEVAAEVEVTLAEPPRLAGRGGGERLRRDAVGTGRVAASVPRLGPGPRVEVEPARGGADDAGQLLVGPALADDVEAGLFGHRVVLELG